MIKRKTQSDIHNIVPCMKDKIEIDKTVRDFSGNLVKEGRIVVPMKFFFSNTLGDRGDDNLTPTQVIKNLREAGMNPKLLR